MQKSQGSKSTARRHPLRVLSSNRAPRVPGSLRRKPAPPAASPSAPAPAAASAEPALDRITSNGAPQSVGRKPDPPSSAASADEALDRLLLAHSDLAGLVSQIDKLVSSALQHRTISNRGKQEIESFSCFLADTNSSLKQWSSRLKQAFEASPAKNGNASQHTMGTCSISAAKRNGKLFSNNSNLPDAGPTKSPSQNLVCSSSNLHDTDLIVSPSPLVSWRTGACMVESGKQLFLLTPLPKTKACLARSLKSELKTTASMDQLNLPNLPVWKLTISGEDRPDLEQSVKLNEVRNNVLTPRFIKTKKGSSEDSISSPFNFSIQKSRRALPSPCLKTALSGKQQLFSPISEGSRKEDILSTGPAEGDKPSGASADVLSDDVSKDLASRYPDLYGFNQPTRNTHRRREADETLDWFLSPLKTCVLMDLPDDKPIPTPARDSKSLIGTPWKVLESNNLKGRQEISDDKPIQTPALHSKALLGTPWKDLESTNLKGRHAGETTLKKELWTRFEAASTSGLHFDPSVFHKSDGKRFIDMLEEAS